MKGDNGFMLLLKRDKFSTALSAALKPYSAIILCFVHFIEEFRISFIAFEVVSSTSKKFPFPLSTANLLPHILN